MDDGGIGKSFWLKMVSIVVGLGVLGLLGFAISDGLAYRFGIVGHSSSASGS